MSAIDTAPAGASVPDVIARCQRIVAERRSSAHPFIATLDQVQPSRPDLGRWAAQKYHQVYLQNVIFSNIHANATEFPDVRQAMMDQLVAEETGLTSGSAPHYTLMRRFAEACGADPALLAREGAAPEVRQYTGTLIDLCRTRHFVLALLVIYSIESQSGESAGKLLAWLRGNHDFTDHELEWFSVHAEDEDDHADAGLALIQRHAGLVPDFATAAVDCASIITDAWLRLHDFYLALLVPGTA
ncbi:MAG: iron-containing redox enzyme family protein [Nocardiopsaceae bacterium]|nr:iron-containing redox enzyme family protein [Nocardiopsaceae bacterium]